jgi:DNA-binding FrmR family transcriptional regulator
MSHTKTAQIKLLNRVKRIRGQIDSVERALAADDHDCADLLMLLAAARGGINGLMGEVLEDHIRLHLLKDGDAPLTPELGEDLIDLVRAYLK